MKKNKKIKTMWTLWFTRAEDSWCYAISSRNTKVEVLETLSPELIWNNANPSTDGFAVFTASAVNTSTPGYYTLEEGYYIGAEEIPLQENEIGESLSQRIKDGSIDPSLRIIKRRFTSYDAGGPAFDLEEIQIDPSGAEIAQWEIIRSEEDCPYPISKVYYTLLNKL
jgi:hypothetical protein